MRDRHGELETAYGGDSDKKGNRGADSRKKICHLTVLLAR
jgi:hypothetical protein